MSTPIRVPSSRPSWRVIQGFFAAMVAVALASACGSGSHAPGLGDGSGGQSPGTAGEQSDSGGAGRASTSHGGGSAGKESIAVSDAGSAGEGLGDGGTSSLPACQPIYTSCDSLCGPVHDPCTGLDLDCGACADGLACDRDTHSCSHAQAQLHGARCASAVEFATPAVSGSTAVIALTGKECDPDTNQCTTCTAPTCADLGIECGTAWLGCGSSKKSDQLR